MANQSKDKTVAHPTNKIGQKRLVNDSAVIWGKFYVSPSIVVIHI